MCPFIGSKEMKSDVELSEKVDYIPLPCKWDPSMMSKKEPTFEELLAKVCKDWK